jgi:hypothetical protein
MKSEQAIVTGKPDPAPGAARPAEALSGFDGSATAMFQTKLKRAPVWFCSFLASNSREKLRLHEEMVLMKGAWPLLMKQRNGGKWTAEEKVHLKTMIRSASSVSPYLFIWALPGSMLLLPFLAWYLDRQRKKRFLRSQL